MIFATWAFRGFSSLNLRWRLINVKHHCLTIFCLCSRSGSRFDQDIPVVNISDLPKITSVHMFWFVPWLTERCLRRAPGKRVEVNLRSSLQPTTDKPSIDWFSMSRWYRTVRSLIWTWKPRDEASEQRLFAMVIICWQLTELWTGPEHTDAWFWSGWWETKTDWGSDGVMALFYHRYLNHFFTQRKIKKSIAFACINNCALLSLIMVVNV